MKDLPNSRKTTNTLHKFATYKEDLTNTSNKLENCKHNKLFGKSDEKTKLQSSQPFMPPNVDKLLSEHVGAFGPWQWFITILCSVTTPNTSILPVYISVEHAHRCLTIDTIERHFEQLNLTFAEAARLIGPWPNKSEKHAKSEGFSFGCLRYRLPKNFTLELYLSKSLDKVEMLFRNASMGKVESCQDGYAYIANEYQYTDSTVADFNLVCTRSWLSATATSVYMFGMLIGFLAGGWLGDRYGRRKTVLVSSILEFISGLAVSLAPNLIVFSILRCVLALSMTSKINCLAILAIEVTLPKYRGIVSAFRLLILNCLLPSFLALSAYYLPSNWRLLNAVTMAPGFLGLALFFWLPESPRWLAAQDNWLDALRILQNGSRINKTFSASSIYLSLTNSWIKNCGHKTQIKSSVLEQKSPFDELIASAQYSLLVVRKKQPSCIRAALAPFSKANLCRTTLLSIILFSSHLMAMFGLLLYASRVRKPIIVVVLSNSVTYLPGLFISCLIGRYFTSRRIPLSILYAICCVCLTSAGLYTCFGQAPNDTLLTAGVSLAIASLSASLALLYAYVPDLYPSKIRAQGLGITSGLGRIGAVLCTYVNKLGDDIKHGLPVLVFAAVIALSFLVVLAMPETNSATIADNGSSFDKIHTEMSIEADENSLELADNDR